MFSQLILSALTATALAQTTTSSSASSTSNTATASATIFVPLSIPPLLSPYISRVSASLISADACAATYALSIRSPLDLRATVTQGPNIYSASIDFGGPNVATCDPFNSATAACRLSGDFVMASARASASFSGSALQSQYYTVPLTAGAEGLSAISGSCSVGATGGGNGGSGTSTATAMTTTGGRSSMGGQSGSGAGMATTSASTTRSGNGGMAPVGVVKVVYRVVVLPVVVAAAML